MSKRKGRKLAEGQCRKLKNGSWLCHERGKSGFGSHRIYKSKPSWAK